MWYEFPQNNSGGEFIVDNDLCHVLFIEANSSEEALEKAVQLGVYLDGVREGRDCPCCGDRWRYPEEITLPIKWSNKTIYNTIEEYAQHLADKYGWTTPDIRIYYKNGSVKEIFIQITYYSKVALEFGQ